MLPRSLVVVFALVCACGGAQTSDEQFIPPPPDQEAPPDSAPGETPSGGAPLSGPYWDLAVQAREVDAQERHDWEASVRALDDGQRALVTDALTAMASEELTVAGLRRAAGRAAAQRFPGADGAVGAFQRGAVFVLGGMVARIGEAVAQEPDPVGNGAELLRTIRALRLPGGADPAPLLSEARQALGATVAAQAEVRSRGRP